MSMMLYAEIRRKAWSARFVYWRDMSETRDKRRKSDLDLFVLALIGSGVSTPCVLQKEAGLSPGATIGEAS